jgi:hypothetical protein
MASKQLNSLMLIRKQLLASTSLMKSETSFLLKKESIAFEVLCRFIHACVSTNMCELASKSTKREKNYCKRKEA